MQKIKIHCIEKKNQQHMVCTYKNSGNQSFVQKKRSIDCQQFKNDQIERNLIVICMSRTLSDSYDSGNIYRSVISHSLVYVFINPWLNVLYLLMIFYFLGFCCKWQCWSLFYQVSFCFTLSVSLCSFIIIVNRNCFYSMSHVH